MLSTLSMSYPILATDAGRFGALLEMKTSKVPSSDWMMHNDPSFEKSRLAFGTAQRASENNSEAFVSTVEEEPSNDLNEDYFLCRKAAWLLVDLWRQKTASALADGSLLLHRVHHGIRIAALKSAEAVAFCRSQLEEEEDLQRRAFVLPREQVAAFVGNVLLGCRTLGQLAAMEGVVEGAHLPQLLTTLRRLGRACRGSPGVEGAVAAAERSIMEAAYST
eukprot:Polyplicarium_translucidae@DN3053_c0_g1_i2.p3